MRCMRYAGIAETNLLLAIHFAATAFQLGIAKVYWPTQLAANCRLTLHRLASRNEDTREIGSTCGYPFHGVYAVAASPCCRDGVTCSPSGRSTTRLHEFFATCRPPVRTGGMGWWVLNDDGDRGWVAVASRVHL